MPPKRKPQDNDSAAPAEDKKKRRIESEEEEESGIATTDLEKGKEKTASRSESQDSQTTIGEEEKMKEEEEGGDTTYVGLEWKVKQLVTAAINLQTMKPALTKHFAEETLDAVSLEDLKAALAALQSIEERDLEEDEDELSNAGKIHILKQVVAYLEHAPYAELPYSCGEVVKEVMTNFYSIRAATTNLLNYRKLQSIHEEINDENVAEHCYESLFNYHIEPLAKNSHEFRTILKYLAETNMTPKTSLQVKEVFVLKEKAAYAEHVHGVAGFESTYHDKKRMLLWHGVPRHQVFHALTAEIPRTAQGSFIFSSQFAYAVCQEQETCNSNYREPAAQENACLLLAEVAVGEQEGLGLRPSFPLSAFRNDPCRLARNWTMERLSDKVLRNDHATHNETHISHEVTKLQDGVVVPQGPVRCLPLGMIPGAPGHAPIYTAPTHKQFRLRFLVVVDYLASDSSSSSSSSSSSLMPLMSSSSSLRLSPPSSSSLPSSLSLPSVPSFPSMSSFPPSMPSMPSSSTSFLPPPLPLSSPSSSSFMLAPSAGSSTFSFTHAPPALPATVSSSSSSAYHYMPPAPAPHTLSSTMPMPLMRSAFTPTTTLTPLRPYAYGPPMMAHSLAPPPPTTMSPSSAGHSMSVDFTLRPLEPDWQFYKPEDGTWESFEETGNWLIESNYQAYRAGGAALPHPTIVGGNGVVYNIDYANMIQYRQDDPDRIRKIRRC